MYIGQLYSTTQTQQEDKSAVLFKVYKNNIDSTHFIYKTHENRFPNLQQYT